MVRLLSSVFHFRVESIAVTLSLRLKRFKTQHAALLWTISTTLIFLAVYGSHTVEQYSRVGRTKALYAVSLVFGGQCLRFRLRKPMVLLALFDISSSKILARYAGNEHFPAPIPRSLLSATPCDFVIRHGRGRGLGPGSNLALPRVVESINVSK